MIKCDLHIHSCHSFDSLARPRDIVKIAVKRGLQCIAIADHGNNKGSLEAAEYAKHERLPIVIIISEEVKSKQGDILALNIKEPISDKLEAKETLNRIKKQGGLAVMAHPFGLFCSFKGGLDGLLGQFDGVEALNASVFKGNEQAQEFAKKHNLPFTAGSDTHFANQFIGKVWLELPLDYTKELTGAQIIQSIKEKRGILGGRAANFIEKAIDHPFRTITKLKGLIK